MRRTLPLFLVVAIFVLFVPSVSALDRKLSIEPLSEITVELPSTNASYELRGNFSASSNIDFCIVNSTDIVVQNNSGVSNLVFTFATADNGTHRMKFINENPYSVEINLTYQRLMTVNAYVPIHFAVGTTTTTGFTLPPPPDDRDSPKLPNLVEKYLNFQAATGILSIVRQQRAYLPFCEIIIAAIALALTIPFLTSKRSRTTAQTTLTVQR